MPATDALLSLRRGLLRTRGFGLFVAVCNQPAERDRLITELEKLLPWDRVDVVRFESPNADPLEFTLEHTKRGSDCPLMLTGLESALEPSDSDHPMLSSLNLRRPDWPIELPRPVVLWVSEKLLAALGRYAPDFLEWRSDTLHFPDDASRLLQEHLVPDVDLHRRVDELRLKIRSVGKVWKTKDISLMTSAAEWLEELSYCYALLNSLNEAERCLRRAWSMRRALSRRIAPVSGFPYILADASPNARAYERDASRSLAQKKFREAEGYIACAIRINMWGGRYSAVARNYGVMSRALLGQGRLVAAEIAADWRLDIENWLAAIGVKESWRLATGYRELGRLMLLQNKHAEAERMYRLALRFDGSLGQDGDSASDFLQLGDIENRLGHKLLARINWEIAVRMFRSLGNVEKAKEVESLRIRDL